MHNNITYVLKASIWGTYTPDVFINEEVFQELKEHTLLALCLPILSSLNMDDSIRKQWKQSALQQISYNAQYKYIQSALPLSIPYVILKGTSAAQYYQYPECRTMGDIDIITKHEDYQTACEMLLRNGYKEIVPHVEDNIKRHRSFSLNGFIIEVHSFFALLSDPEKAAFLDQIIIDNINPSHILPDMINGAVLLEHINQHLENGLGLRQIIDWMMFVYKCLPDEKWPEFQVIAQKIGLEKLAMVTTRMCEIYLGLPVRKWCSETETYLCEQLMEYILACGNFGNKKTTAEDISANVFARASTLRSAMRLLQERGMYNWRLVRKHKALRLFAWAYQAIRYMVKGLQREHFQSKLKTEYKAAKKRKKMFEMLGVKTMDKGIAIYKDGKYIKS